MATRTITLTGRAPVNIAEETWPIIAQASEDDGTNSFRSWKLFVRQHADGRTLVYGVHRSAYQDEPNLRSGELLPDASEAPSAIHRAAVGIGAPDHLAEECIGNLPAEDL